MIEGFVSLWLLLDDFSEKSWQTNCSFAYLDETGSEISQYLGHLVFVNQYILVTYIQYMWHYIGLVYGNHCDHHYLGTYIPVLLSDLCLRMKSRIFVTIAM